MPQTKQTGRSRPGAKESAVGSIVEHWRAWVFGVVVISIVITMFTPIVRFMGFDTRGAAYAEYRNGYNKAQELRRTGSTVDCWEEAKRSTGQTYGDLVRAFQLGCDDSQPTASYDKFDYKANVDRYVLNSD